MAGFIDLYKVLQVDHKAEQEVVDAAYRRLCRKYHPDVNSANEAEATLKGIVAAYEVLGSPAARRQYDTQWQSHSRGNAKEHLSLQVLNQYFGFIARQNFEAAYGLLSRRDHQQISFYDFQQWQQAVSRSYQLIACEPRMVTPSARSTALRIVYEVAITERNLLFDQIVQDELVRIMVQERGQWRVYLGYGDLNSFISRFESLSATRAGGSFEDGYLELEDSYFSHVLYLECERNRRYGNESSLLHLRLDLPADVISWLGEERLSLLRELMLKLVRKNLRGSDSLGRAEGLQYNLLLPETTLAEASAVARKLALRLEDYLGLHNIVSAGQASCTGEDVQALLLRASRNLRSVPRLQ